MCGDIPPGHSARDIVVVLPTDSASALIRLPFQFKNVTEIRLREYSTIGATTGVYRCKLANDIITDQQSNALGDGFVFSLVTAAAHVHYDNPIVVARYERGSVSQLNVQVARLDPVTLAPGTAVTYTSLHFLFQIVTRDEKYDRQLVDSIGRDQVLNATLPYIQQMPFQQIK